MALPLRGTAKSGTATNGGDPTLTFDTGAGAPLEGDVVILFGGRGNSSDANAFGPITSGYTEVASNSGTGVKFGVWYKVMGATPDTSVQCEGGGNAASAVAYGAFVLDGSLIDAAIFDATATTVVQGARVPNCAAITTVTDGAWVIALYGNGLVDTSRGVPSGYTTIVGNSANDSDDISIDAAYIEKAVAGAEDPGNWSTWSSGTGYGVTLAIRPKAEEHQLVTPGLATLALTAFAAVVSLTANVSVTPGTATVTLAAQSPAVTATAHVQAVPGTTTLAVAAQAPTVTATSGVVVTPGTAALSLTEFAPSVSLSDNVRVTPGVASLSITGQVPPVVVNQFVRPGVASLTLSGFSPEVATPRTVTPGVAGLNLTGFAPSVNVGTRVTIGTAALSAAAFAPAVTTTEHVRITPGTASMAVSSFAPSVAASQTVTPGVAALVCTAFGPTVTVGEAVPVLPLFIVRGTPHACSVTSGHPSRRVSGGSRNTRISS